MAAARGRTWLSSVKLEYSCTWVRSRAWPAPSARHTDVERGQAVLLGRSSRSALKRGPWTVTSRIKVICEPCHQVQGNSASLEIEEGHHQRSAKAGAASDPPGWDAARPHQWWDTLGKEAAHWDNDNDTLRKGQPTSVSGLALQA